MTEIATRLRWRVARARRRARDRTLGAGAPDHKTLCEDLALRYLHGEGIEIGALNFPLRVPAGVRVRYVDRQPHGELVAEYGVLYPDAAIVAPDIVDDGERLASLSDESVDFVIANHMLEHTEDPVGTLRHHARVLRPGGVLFLSLPDPRETLDAPRERTPVAHLLADHAEGPQRSRRAHYEEWARHGEQVAEEEVAARAAALEAEQANIHFHVWEPAGFVAMLDAVDDLPLDLELIQRSAHEFVAILRRTG